MTVFTTFGLGGSTTGLAYAQLEETDPALYAAVEAMVQQDSAFRKNPELVAISRQLAEATVQDPMERAALNREVARMYYEGVNPQTQIPPQVREAARQEFNRVQERMRTNLESVRAIDPEAARQIEIGLIEAERQMLAFESGERYVPSPEMIQHAQEQFREWEAAAIARGTPEQELAFARAEFTRWSQGDTHFDPWGGRGGVVGDVIIPPGQELPGGPVTPPSVERILQAQKMFNEWVSNNPNLSPADIARGRRDLMEWSGGSRGPGDYGQRGGGTGTGYVVDPDGAGPQGQRWVERTLNPAALETLGLTPEQIAAITQDRGRRDGAPMGFIGREEMSRLGLTQEQIYRVEAAAGYHAGPGWEGGRPMEHFGPMGPEPWRAGPYDTGAATRFAQELGLASNINLNDPSALRQAMESGQLTKADLDRMWAEGDTRLKEGIRTLDPSYGPQGGDRGGPGPGGYLEGDGGYRTVSGDMPRGWHYDQSGNIGYIPSTDSPWARGFETGTWGPPPGDPATWTPEQRASYDAQYGSHTGWDAATGTHTTGSGDTWTYASEGGWTPSGGWTTDQATSFDPQYGSPMGGSGWEGSNYGINPATGGWEPNMGGTATTGGGTTWTTSDSGSYTSYYDNTQAEKAESYLGSHAHDDDGITYYHYDSNGDGVMDHEHSYQH